MPNRAATTPSEVTSTESTSSRRPSKRGGFVGWASRFGTIASLLLFVIVFSILKPDIFPTSLNFFNILNQVSILGIIALGLTLPLVQGLFDLSIGAMATLGGFIATLWLSDGTISNTILAIGLVIVVSLLIGVVSGSIVSYGGISAFITTLAIGSVLNGAVLGISKSQTVLSGIPNSFLILGQGTIGPVPAPVLVMAVLALLLWVFLTFTQIGRNMYAIGGNAEAARLSGIAIKRYPLIALAISAGTASLAGMAVAANLAVGRPQGVGDTYLLDAFAACFIGAATLRPGRFHIGGTVIGVLLIGVINNGLSVLGVATFWQYIVRGVLLLIAVLGAGFVLVRKR